MNTFAKITDKERRVIGEGRYNDDGAVVALGIALTPRQSFYAEAACQEQPGIFAPICHRR